MIMRKIILLSLLFGFHSATHAQKFKRIFVNLYTDSLKKGTYNYINVDGELLDGRFLPLDTTELKFWSSDGKFEGNSLFIDKDFRKQKVDIRITSKSQPSFIKEFALFVKQKEDERLPTAKEVLESIKKQKSKPVKF
ncbi:MAG: hypothetical protein NVS3B19_10550 [Ginsengibacter sp.]